MDPQPITVTDQLLVQVRDELRALRQSVGGSERGAGELREPAKPKAAAKPRAAAKTSKTSTKKG